MQNMDSTISVSKGCFVFKNGATRADKTVKKVKKRNGNPDITKFSVLGEEITDQEFYKVYRETCNDFMDYIETLQRNSYSETLENLVEYVISSCSGTPLEMLGPEKVLPAAVLMTGINQPDYLRQFETISQRINEKNPASVCILHSRDCPTIKAAIESMIYGFIETPFLGDEDEDCDRKCLRRSHCTMRELTQWYKNNHNINTVEQKNSDKGKREKGSNTASCVPKKLHLLVVILPDFECFNSVVLQDLILILSSYTSRLSFVLVMGVATAVSAIHSSLPYHVMRKLRLRIFQTQAAPIVLNEYCLIEHFFQGNQYALCTNYAQSLLQIPSLTHDDLESIRRLLSFRPFVEKMDDSKAIILILTDDNYFKESLPPLLRECHVYFALFRIFLEFLTVLVEDLPKCPLGKQRRELYSACSSKNVTAEPEFKECWQILSFMSKEEIVAKFTKAIKDTEKIADTVVVDAPGLADEILQIVKEKLSLVSQLLTQVDFAGKQKGKSELCATKAEQLKSVSRQELKEKLLKMSTQSKSVTEFSQSLNTILVYVQEEIVAKLLRPLSLAPPLHELFVFTDLSKVRRNVIGAPRAALHMALNNPNFYLQCKCCTLSDSAQLLPTLPDLSVAYKLHLECGRMINLFDWLQAFRSVVEDVADGDHEQIAPQIQARFTRAIAELQFLGYIKMSKRKTDHATRLTW